MGRDKSTLRFWLRTDRPNKLGSAPVHLVYQIRGQKNCYSVPEVSLYSVNWDKDDQEAKYVDKKTAKKLAPDVDYDLLLSEDEADKINGKRQQVRSDIDK